jgi:hypothetical protein
MEKKSYLLPHKFQILGWCLFGAIFVVFALEMLVWNTWELIPQKYSKHGTMLLYLLAFGSAFLVAFSQEKQEDEFISALRRKSVMMTACIMFFLMIAYGLLYAIWSSVHPTAGNFWRYFFIVWRFTGNIIFALMLYAVLFRIKYWRYKWESGKDEK